MIPFSKPNTVIKSVGIDIGTSTTKLIISHLTIGRVSSHFALPHFDIVDRKIAYMSEIISTPLIDENEIDLGLLVSWLEKEYQMAGFTFSDIGSGAVIITGETAIKKNADALVHYLAERSGDFVVAIAGASLEGVLAGRGSGASEYSKKTKGIVANIDIGGGTANVALFKQGRVLETITFHIGGKLIQLNRIGEVLSVSPPLEKWLLKNNFKLQQGHTITFFFLKEIVSTLCCELLDVLSGKKSITDLEPIIHSTSCSEIPKIDYLMISGGIGSLQHERPPTSLEEVTAYNDIGPILASELTKALNNYPFQQVEALQTSRATVIGAGMQTTKISGSTISIQSRILPLRNIPVVKIILSDLDFKRSVENAIQIGRELFQHNDQLPFAFGITGLNYLSYLELKELASNLREQYEKYVPTSNILVIICENDMAKALGQLLRLESKGDFVVICIDQVKIEHGDYIDIGEPLNDSMVPVVVKTLAFS